MDIWQIPEEHDLECNDEGDLVQTVERTATSLEDVIKQPFQVIKAANNGETVADLLKGVRFRAYLESSLKKNKDVPMTLHLLLGRADCRRTDRNVHG